MVKKTTRSKKSTKKTPAFHEAIVLQGVRTNNLNDIDVTIPKNLITTVTGVSGSGKSSLAFSTIYKEGQFRYIESLSSYLRQFFSLGTRPEIDYSSGLSPAIAIEQNKRVGNTRSTVGTLTEIDDYLRLLMAKVGQVFCHKCGKILKPKTTDQIVTDIKTRYDGSKVYLLQELKAFQEEADLARWVRKNRKRVDQGGGFTRFLIGYSWDKDTHEFVDSVEYFYLEDPKVPKKLFPVNVYGIFDRVTINDSTLKRLKDDSIKMLSRADKFGVMIIEGGKADKKMKAGKTVKKDASENISLDAEIEAALAEDTIDENESGHTQGFQPIIWYTDKYYCAQDNISYPEFTTQHFSSNRQEGACTTCHGIGEELQVDFDKVMDPFSPFLQAILPWRDSRLGQAILKKLAHTYKVDENAVWSDLPDRFTEVVIHGDEELMRVNVGGGKYISMYYKGIQNVLADQYNKGILTVDFQAMLDLKACSMCRGAKLRQESLHVFLTSQTIDAETELTHEDELKDKKNIYEFQSMSIDDLVKYMKKYQKTTKAPKALVERILTPLVERAETIGNLGLGYINTSRKIDSLSGGEIQRLRLAKQLGNKLTGIIYVLDEPTIGLDEGEITKVISSIKQLKEMGNTIIVVEHNDLFIKASDWIVEIGPGAGDFGGDLLFSGAYKDFVKTDTLTAQYITGKKKIEATFDHIPSKESISIKKANKHNLQNINVDIKLGSFTIITGPSGAGKTTLMYHTLFKFLSDKQQYIQSVIRLKMLKKGMSRSDIIQAPVMKREEYEHLEQLAVQEFYEYIGVDTITGHSGVENVMYVNQSSIGKTPRSCPATFVGVFDDIRKLFAGATESKMLGFNTGHFSFNSSKGACPECKGYGYKKVELQFLPDTYVPCQLCKGARYKPEILDIKWHDKTISDVLSMYVHDAYEFFEDMPYIAQKLKLMVEIGLGYLKMGQPAHTLSGGESQRLKLVKHLLKSYRGHTVYFLDEPTVGLHPSDIERLLAVLKKFLDNGDTILMIEHEKNLLQFADKVIRLDNGKIVKSK